MIRKIVQKLHRLIEKLRPFYHYAAALFLAVIFALYCSGRVGWFLVLMLLFAPVISVLTAWMFTHFIEVEAHMPSAVLSKGEATEAYVICKNRSYLPSPVMEVILWTSAGVEAKEDILNAAVLPKQALKLSTEITAVHGGASYVVTAETAVRDYLGLVRFKVKHFQMTSGNVYTLPDIAEIPGEKEYMRALCSASAAAEENEETLDQAAPNFGGFPGFEHRMYRPGDPMKRINWKLSAGKQELFVRLDETMVGTGISVVLDCTGLDWKKPQPLLRNNTMYEGKSPYELSAILMEQELETTLGIIRNFLRREQKVSVFYNEAGTWQTRTLIQEDQLPDLQLQFSKQRFFEKNDIDLPENMILAGGKVGALLAVSIMPNEKLSGQLTDFAAKSGASVSLYSVLHGEGRML